MKKNRETGIKIAIGFLLLIALAYGGLRFYSYYRHTHGYRYVESVGRTDADIVKKAYRFGDLNDVHLRAAKKKGITPVASRDCLKTEQLTKIESCDLYKVDKLTHSVAYLTPEAANLLSDIGIRFQNALEEEGLRKHRVIVTSVLRTGEDVNRLRKTNVNASANSAHQYATTFDITYVRFDCRSLIPHRVDNEQLANVLGTVLEQLRKEGRCYVKYERKQRCFHITSRD